MNYSINELNPTIAYIKADSIIDNIFTLLPTIITYYFEPGNYYINDILRITKSNIKLISTSKNPKDVHIFQLNEIKDSIDIRFCKKVSLIGLSIHNNHPNKIALTVASASNIIISKCYMYGNNNTFTVFFAGPSGLIEGENTLAAYNTGLLDMRNSFINNVVYSNWSGDSVSFSLQQYGTFERNIIRGGKVAVYMCKKCDINNNIVYDSTTNGFYISLPSHNILVSNNKIYECKQSGIKISNQSEHGIFEPSEYSITLTKNKIYDSKIYAIELNDADKINIDNNIFISTDRYGIYGHNSKNLIIENNKMSYFSVGLWLEKSSNIQILNNDFYSVYPDEGQNVFKINDNCNSINISYNHIMGKIIYDMCAIDNTCTDVNIIENNIDPYYSYDDEIKIMKL